MAPQVHARSPRLLVSACACLALAGGALAQIRTSQAPAAPPAPWTIAQVARTASTPVACLPGTAQTCPAGSATLTVTDTDCFGCPLGTQFAEWRSEPWTNPPLPANAPRLRVDKYVPNPQFCERVIQVDVTVRGDAQGILRLENRDLLNGCTGQMTLQIDLLLQAVGVPALPTIPLGLLHAQAVPLGPFDGLVDFGGPSGISLVVPPVSQSICNRFTDPADLAYFVSATPDVLEFAHTAADSSGTSGCAPCTVQSDPYASLQVEVVYTVCRLAPPDAADDTASTCTNTPANIPVLANDASLAPLLCPAAGSTAGLGAVSPAGAGTVSWFNGGCANGLCPGLCVRFVPSPTFTGTATFPYTLTDTNGCSDTANVTVLVGQPGASCGPGTVTSTQTVSDCFGCPLGSTPAAWSTPGVPRLRLPKVALAPGQELVQVRAAPRLRLRWTGQVENQDPLSGCSLTADLTATLTACPTVAPPGPCTSSGLCLSVPIQASQVLNLAPFDGVPDFGGPSGATFALSPPDTTSTAVFSDPATLAHFTDANPIDGITEYVEFDHAAQAQATVSGGCSSLVWLHQEFASIEVTLEYTVCTVGVPTCPGDGSGTACPCGNTSPAGAGLGCMNSTGLGGELRAVGVPSLAADTLQLTAHNLTGTTALFVQGSMQDNGGLGTMLGDGLRCIDGSIVRLATNPNAAGAASFPIGTQLPVSLRGGIGAPGSRYYQVHYRNSAPFCTLATFNLTNGLWIEWRP